MVGVAQERRDDQDALGAHVLGRRWLGRLVELYRRKCELENAYK